MKWRWHLILTLSVLVSGQDDSSQEQNKGPVGPPIMPESSSSINNGNSISSSSSIYPNSQQALPPYQPSVNYPQWNSNPSFESPYWNNLQQTDYSIPIEPMYTQRHYVPPYNDYYMQDPWQTTYTYPNQFYPPPYFQNRMDYYPVLAPPSPYLLKSSKSFYPSYTYIPPPSKSIYPPYNPYPPPMSKGYYPSYYPYPPQMSKGYYPQPSYYPPPNYYPYPQPMNKGYYQTYYPSYYPYYTKSSYYPPAYPVQPVYPTKSTYYPMPPVKGSYLTGSKVYQSYPVDFGHPGKYGQFRTSPTDPIRYYN